ncbi:hypothetical protein GCM10007063_05650 [Lentibacillus kapialis]|uniref:Uncharacterized protein n=1 Tax=Lentibacillus kapialis TaxID=340214 RepID=A0A917PNB4_9BACI|nr:hypothetical protein [Lentibacillus kapialis]GGJ86024.1 hypothetical protein GCM10007063_05650 [Lentibacillus kapialis]
MDKEKAYELFKEVLDAYHESEMMAIHERSTDPGEEDKLNKDYEDYVKEMKRHLGI